MKAIVLIGHGSVKSASGASMIRMSARLREQEVAHIAAAGFLNYSRPTLAEAVEKVVELGASLVVVQPYFLIDGVYVRHDLHQEVLRLHARFPGVAFRIAESFGSHAQMANIAFDRVQEADPALGAENKRAALLVIAHGTPMIEANTPVLQVAGAVHARTGYRQMKVAYLDCNQPTIPQAIDSLASAGMQRLVILPYFLQYGRHVRSDLPRLIQEGRQRHDHLEICLTHHLDYDLRLVDVIVDRVGQANVLSSQRLAIIA